MVRECAIGLATAAAAVLLAATATHAAGAATVQLSGNLSGATLPGPAAGVSVVHALNLGDGTLAAADYVDRRGRYAVKVPPGPYALVGGSVFFKRGLPTVKLVGALRARAGKSRRLSLSVRPFRRRARHLGARETATRGSVASRIVGVPYFTGAAPYQNRGLASMVETDIVQRNQGPPCAFTVVEVQRRDEIVREIRLQQTRFFDPASTVRPGRLLQPNHVVRGSLVPQAGGALAYTIQVMRDGRVKGSISGRIPENAWLTASEGIARELAKIICDDTPLYVGTVNGAVSIDDPRECGDHQKFSYGASLGGFAGQQPFAIVAGSGSLIEGQGAKAYDESGDGSYVLPPCESAQTPGCSTGFRRRSNGSYGQVLFDVEGSMIKATAIPFDWEATTDACGGVGPLGNVTTIGEGSFPLSMVGAETITVALSRRDGAPLVAVGNGTLTLRRAN